MDILEKNAQKTMFNKKNVTLTKNCKKKIFFCIFTWISKNFAVSLFPYI